MTAPHELRWSSAGGDQNRGGGSRDFTMGLHFERGLLLRLAGALAHLVVVAAASGMAGVGGGEHFHGGRSSGTCGFGVVVHGRGSWCVC